MLLAESLLGSSSAVETAYIEDVFSTWLYTGNSSTQTINNGIDLAGKGGLVWIKGRNATWSHNLYDTARGVQNYLMSNASNAQINRIGSVTSFNSNGFTMGGWDEINNSSADIYVSWTFREQPKFFDVVTWTGNGSSSQQISHALASVPGCIIVKRTDSPSDWFVWHRKNGLSNSTTGLSLNGQGAAFEQSWNVDGTGWVTSTTFQPASGLIKNTSGASVDTSGTYVAYLFAHDAGGFGATGADNVISCGSYVGNGSTTGPTVTLGYEPQWVMVKRANNVNSWYMVDTMRGFAVPQTSRELAANSSAAESADYAGAFPIRPLATGFQPYSPDSGVNGNGDTYIYIAIRRGPMRTPTSGTSVFSPIASSAATGTTLTTGFPVDAQILGLRTSSFAKQVYDRLRGVSSTTTDSGAILATSSTAAETTNGNTRLWDNQGFQMPSYLSGSSTVFWNFRRAPGFFDVVCYTGNAASNTQSHNLGVAPELVITKSRSSAQNWLALHTFTASNHQYQFLNTNNQQAAATYASNVFLSSRPTATQLPVTGPYSQINASGTTYVAYLFASCPGVSKVGSYTGTGATQTINCGFSAGARFVLIKRTDSTGDWYVWDSARGIVAGNDPYILLNSTAAEVTTTDWVDTAASGFELSNAAGNNVNINGASYIFMSVS